MEKANIILTGDVTDPGQVLNEQGEPFMVTRATVEMSVDTVPTCHLELFAPTVNVVAEVRSKVIILGPEVGTIEPGQDVKIRTADGRTFQVMVATWDEYPKGLRGEKPEAQADKDLVATLAEGLDQANAEEDQPQEEQPKVLFGGRRP